MTGDIAGVVVNYNAKEYLLTCVASLLDEGVDVVIVADNGSVDGSEAALSSRYPEAKWAETGSNLGYGAAADLGAALSDSAYLLVCNPDVVLGEGSVATLRKFLEAQPDVAVVGPRIVDGKGALYPSARRFPDLAGGGGARVPGTVLAGQPLLAPLPHERLGPRQLPPGRLGLRCLLPGPQERLGGGGRL